MQGAKIGQFAITIEGRQAIVTEGETIAGALLRLGERHFRTTARQHRPRSYFCGMGICFDCLVEVDGALVQACQKRVRPGMQVSTSTNLQTKFP